MQLSNETCACGQVDLPDGLLEQWEGRQLRVKVSPVVEMGVLRQKLSTVHTTRGADFKWPDANAIVKVQQTQLLLLFGKCPAQQQVVHRFTLELFTASSQADVCVCSMMHRVQARRCDNGLKYADVCCL